MPCAALFSRATCAWRVVHCRRFFLQSTGARAKSDSANSEGAGRAFLNDNEEDANATLVKRCASQIRAFAWQHRPIG